MIEYCSVCVMPDTRPDTTIINGKCSACRSYDARDDIDWNKRKEEFLKITGQYRSKSSNWDCIVPVSGGKDSTYQVIKILQLGLNPLCVCATTCDLSDLGRYNLENLRNLGVDLIEVSTNPRVRSKLNRIGLEMVGDISWPEHVSIFTIPVQIAVKFAIPLIIWGENSQNEFGGPAAKAENNVLDRAWLEEFGGLLGLRVSDLNLYHDISDRDLSLYTYPSDEQLKSVGVTGLFLGHYFPWDGLSNALIAGAHGFKNYGGIVEGTLLPYENLDNYYHGIHDYFKFLKFGFGRATDHACLLVRRGRLDRQTALQLVRKHDGKYPRTYLGKNLDTILEKIKMTNAEFDEICDQFTNREIFITDAMHNLSKDAYGDLIKINYDNE